MLAQARALDVTPTGSALEAALLEPDEIKRLCPPYNVALQEKDRRLGYWSWSLRGVALRPDDRHPLGPFPLQAARPPLSALLQLLDSEGGARQVERLRASVLGVPRRYAPSRECFRAGLDLFVRRHGPWWRRGSPVAALFELARRLRRRRTPDPDAERAPEDDPSRPQARWSAEGVAGALEEVVVRGAGVIRRARWMCALCESSVAWTRGEAGERRCVVLSRGAIVARHDLTAGSEVPTPPGHGLPRWVRQELIDLATYDRLSALSRELRALVSGEAPIELRLGPDSALDRRALEQALQCL
jgi:DNA polymerase-3 subunit epsilon